MSMLNKKAVNDIDVKGKKVIVRCDFNVTIKDDVILDDTKIVKSLKTLKKPIDTNPNPCYNKV